jgi:hypothetical protein
MIKTLRDYDITGFVNFPHLSSRNIKSIDSGKTLIFLVAFEENNYNLKLPLVGNFCGDDVIPRPSLSTNNKTLESAIKDLMDEEEGFTTRDFYFKNEESFPVISSILLGWSKYSYEFNDRVDSWCCTFRDLTNEGRKLYYSMKKLHNDSEIRILTFNNIKQ